MKQLIQIENIPIRLNVKTTWAKFERPDPLENIISSAVNRSVHSYQNISSMRRHNVADVYERQLYSGSDCADVFSAEIRGKYAASGQDESSAEYMKAAVKSSQLQPPVRSEALSSNEVLVADAMKQYSLDRNNFDMNVSFGIKGFEFVPGSVEFTVSQRPEVRIEYIGSPIYVPRSADPEYVDVVI